MADINYHQNQIVSIVSHISALHCHWSLAGEFAIGAQCCTKSRFNGSREVYELGQTNKTLFEPFAFRKKARKAVKWKSIKPTELEMTKKSGELVIYDGALSAGEKLTQCNSDLPDEEHETRLSKLKTQNSAAISDAEDAAAGKSSSISDHCSRPSAIVSMKPNGFLIRTIMLTFVAANFTLQLKVSS